MDGEPIGLVTDGIKGMKVNTRLNTRLLNTSNRKVMLLFMATGNIDEMVFQDDYESSILSVLIGRCQQDINLSSSLWQI